MSKINRTISIAPMLDWTDRHERYFLRLISPNSLLYTEMVTTGAILHGDQDRHLKFNEPEHPLALQLGGSDPKDLAKCAKLAKDYGYDEVNLNVGCPSDRVQKGRFGACLMNEPSLVADCVQAMMEAVDIPITVKSRIGVDNNDSYDSLTNFTEKVQNAGCNTLIVHARKAWLKGLSPKQNRDVPPLQYPTVYQLKTDFPDLEIIINGGIQSLEEVQGHLKQVDGVMIGRKAYHDPYFLAELERSIFNVSVNSRQSILNKLLPYVEQHLLDGGKLSNITRHILGLFNGLPGAKQWRRYLSENAHKKGAGLNVLKEAISVLEDGASLQVTY